MQQHRDLPMSPLVQAVNLLAKGIALISYTLVLQAYKLAGVRKAIATLIEQRSCKRRYIQIEKTLIVGDVQDLIAKKDSSVEVVL
jgi:hypothetical protein